VSAYEKLIPKQLDIVILSVGDDGHVASIFPDSEAYLEKKKYFIESSSPVAPGSRVTLTYPAIMNAKKVYILGVTPEKKDILLLANSNKLKSEILPVKKIINGEWIVNTNIREVADYLLDSIFKEVIGSEGKNAI
jgi:6-phosphogluconolactonase